MTAGTVIDTDVDWPGDTLAAATTAGSAVLSVLSVVDFDDEDGGWLVVGDSAPMVYLSADEDAGTVTLAAPVGAVYELGTPVYLYDPDAPTDEKRSLDYYVIVQPHDDNKPFRALVTDERAITAGVDKLIGASVGLEPLDEEEDSWRVAVVYGRETALDLSTADVSTAPPGLGDGGGGSGQTVSTEPPPATTDGYAEDHFWWQVVDNERIGTWRVSGSSWLPVEVITQQAIENLGVLNLSAVNMRGGSISIAQGVSGTVAQAFSGTSMPSGWVSLKTADNGQPLDPGEGTAVPGALVVNSGPTGQVGSALLVDFGSAGLTDPSTAQAGGTITSPLPVSADAEASIRFRVQASEEPSFTERAYLTLRSSGTPNYFSWDAIVMNLIPFRALGFMEFQVSAVDNGFTSNLMFVRIEGDPATTWCRAKLKVQAGSVFAKVWVDGDPEPAWRIATGSALPTTPGVTGIVWSSPSTVSASFPTRGQKLWLDSFDATSLATGFQVTPDGIMTSPATGIGVGDPTWRTVGASGQPAFTNGWTALSGDTVQFRRSATGDVAIVGRAVPGSASAAVFTLPDGYRPTRDLTDIIVRSQGNSSATMDILANGQIQVRNISTSTWVSLTWAFPAN